MIAFIDVLSAYRPSRSVETMQASASSSAMAFHQKDRANPQPVLMHVVLDHHLEASLKVMERGDHQREHQYDRKRTSHPGNDVVAGRTESSAPWRRGTTA